MGKPWLGCVVALCAGCAGSAPVDSEDRETSEPAGWDVLVEESATYDGMPVTVRVKRSRGSPARVVAAVDVVARTSDWELFAETEPYGKDAFLLLKLFQPGPGTPLVHEPETLTAEAAFESQPRRLLVRGFVWQDNVYYVAFPTWDELGAITVPDEP